MPGAEKPTNFHHSIQVEKDYTAAKLTVIQGEFLVYIGKSRYELFSVSAGRLWAGLAYLLADYCDLR